MHALEVGHVAMRQPEQGRAGPGRTALGVSDREGILRVAVREGSSSTAVQLTRHTDTPAWCIWAVGCGGREGWEAGSGVGLRV